MSRTFNSFIYTVREKIMECQFARMGGVTEHYFSNRSRYSISLRSYCHLLCKFCTVKLVFGWARLHSEVKGHHYSSILQSHATYGIRICRFGRWVYKGLCRTAIIIESDWSASLGRAVGSTLADIIQEIQDRLKISYEPLSKEDQSIFWILLVFP